MVFVVWWIACGGPPSQSAGSDTGGPPRDCVAAEIDEAGGVLEHGAARLEVPAGALGLVQEVRLCREPTTRPLVIGSAWEVGPPELQLVIPARLAIVHDDVRERLAHLFVPAADGSPRRVLEPERPVVGTVAGEVYRPGEAFAALDARITAPYVAAEGPIPLDLLFVVDNSHSMAQEQEALGARYGELHQALVDMAVDFHVGVTTTDLASNEVGSGGTLVRVDDLAWVGVSTVNPTDVFGRMAAVGTSGSSIEKGRGAAYTALELLRTNPANAGFRREDAALAVVMVTDEDDDTQDFLITIDEFVAWLADTSPRGTVFAVVEPATAGSYPTLAEATGGWMVGLSTTDWGFAAMAAHAVERPSPMRLPGPIVAETLEVWRVRAGTEPVRIPSGAVHYEPGTVWIDVDVEDPSDVVLLFETE